MTKDAAKWIEEVNGLLKQLLNCGSVTGFDKQMKYLITNKPDNSINAVFEHEQDKNLAFKIELDIKELKRLEQWNDKISDILNERITRCWETLEQRIEQLEKDNKQREPEHKENCSIDMEKQLNKDKGMKLIGQCKDCKSFNRMNITGSCTNPKGGRNPGETFGCIEWEGK